MDLLAYIIKYFKENDVIQHDSLEEEIDFLTQKVNEIKDKQHELNVNYSEIMKCTEDEIKQKYDEYRNKRLQLPTFVSQRYKYKICFYSLSDESHTQIL